MNRDETKQIMEILRTSYPNFYRNFTDEEKTNAINLWWDMFSDNPASHVGLAVKALISTCKFPPAISEVKDYIQKLTRPEEMSGYEAWNFIRGAFEYKATAEGLVVTTEFGPDYSKYFDKLPDLVKSVVGNQRQLRIWADVPEGELEQYERPRFIKSFEARQKATAEYGRLPESVREQSRQIQGVSIDGLVRIAERKRAEQE
jgi:hypothetical protein